ncbi:MAG: ATP-binding protein [Pseudomonadaceae bacterium]|nr:ATP-binding protein [Pseudomonadaceae bacterium]
MRHQRHQNRTYRANKIGSRSLRLIVITAVTLASMHAEAVSQTDQFSFANLHRLNAADLQQLVETSTGTDQIRARLVLARSKSRRDFASGRAALQLLNDYTLRPSEQVYLYALECGISVRSGDMPAAEKACAAARQDLKPELDHSVQAQAYDALGSLATRQGRVAEALTYYEQGLSAAVTADDQEMLYVLHHNRATPLINMGITDLAIRSLETSRRYLDVLPEDSQLPGILLYNLGYMQAQRGAHQTALKEYQRAIEWLDKLGHQSRMYIAKTQIAKSYTALGQPETALETLLPWLERSDITLSPDSIADAYFAMANAYTALNQFSDAQTMVVKGLAIARAQANPLRLQQLTLAQVDLALQQDNYLQAQTLLTDLIDTYTLDTGFRVTILDRMAQTQAALGNYEAAWAYSSEHKQLDAKVRSQDFDLRLSSLRVAGELDQANYDLALSRERERTAELQSATARSTRNAAIAVALLIVAFGFLVFRRIVEKREAVVQQNHTHQLEQQVSERTADMQHEMQRRIEAEQANTNLQKRVAEAERLRTIGQLTGGVAHDFNNLLTVILLSADLLKADPQDQKSALINDIIHAGESGKAITQSLLAYARQQELQPEPMRLDKYLQRRLSLFQRTLGDDIELTLDTVPATITADRGQLTACLVNLLFNAHEAMGNSGKITIATKLVSPSSVEMKISDNGAGMSEDILQKATEPFYTTKKEGQGSGLGLSMAFGFMKQSGGELSIASELEVGTTVTLTFPASATDETQVAENPTNASFSDRLRKVLLIDDQDSVRDVCRSALEGMNFTVWEANTGIQGLEHILAADDFDLVVSDAVMPGGISGLEVANTLADVQPTVPVILMSGGPVETPENCHFLAKPFSLDQLEQMIRQVMR